SSPLLPQCVLGPSLSATKSLVRIASGPVRCLPAVPRRHANRPAHLRRDSGVRRLRGAAVARRAADQAAARRTGFGCRDPGGWLARRSGRLAGDGADVAQERQRVPLAPALYHLAVVVEAVDADALNGVALLAGGLESHELV